MPSRETPGQVATAVDLRDRGVQALLLGRPPRPLDSTGGGVSLAGRRVLVTGAGGSVGSELARQVAAARPRRLVLVDQSEYPLFQVTRALREQLPARALEARLVDVTRRREIRRLCAAVRPDVVYHAAAYKHVGMLERDICAAIRGNVLASAFTADAARQVEADFVLVSTDKAAAPRSVMGASKRMAEMVVLASAAGSFRPVAVRFGNVLGSSGSVVELMLDRVTRGRPIEITDPDATRYFMTAAEAATLVMSAPRLGPAPAVYWLDMGAPVRIGDLATRLLALAVEAGLSPVPIAITGLAPGEKLREEFPTAEVVSGDGAVAGVRQVRADHLGRDEADALVRRLRRGVRDGDSRRLLAEMRRRVPGYIPSPAAIGAARGAPAGRPASPPVVPGRRLATAG